MNEPPQRITSFVPAEHSSAAPRAMTFEEGNSLVKQVCDDIWVTDILRMFDRIVDADRRGHIDDTLYSHLLDFFYCLLLMVVRMSWEPFYQCGISDEH